MKVLRAVVVLVLGTATTGCGPAPFVPGPSTSVAESPPEEVATVLYLVGDAGEARVEDTPLVHRLRSEVERWSGALSGDSAVAVVYLGDNVYPEGLREPEDPDFSTDSARLMAQVWTVSGPEARAHGTPAFFLPGNHDWGNRPAPDGLARLQNQTAFLHERAAEGGDGGPAVELVPSTPGSDPTVVDLGGPGPQGIRLILLDTQWWLQSESGAARDRLLEGLATALRTAGDRVVVVAAHHPYRSGGPHAHRSLLDPFGLLARAGAIVQDLSAPPYQALSDGLERVFREEGRPLLYAAGHDHSLQVFRGDGPEQPEWSVVSGAGSKGSSVTEVPGLVWAAGSPGYMKVVVRTDGRVDLFALHAPERFLRCEGEGIDVCVQTGVAAFSTGFSRRIH